MEVFAFLISVVSLYLVIDLRKRLTELERQNPKTQYDQQQTVPKTDPQTFSNSQPQAQFQPQPASQQSFQVPPIPQGQIPLKTYPMPTFKTSKNAKDPFTMFFEWFKDDWLLKLGILILLIGFGWFISYAFLNNWIGPVGRVVFGFIMGVTLMLFGWQRIKKYLHQGSAFLVFGSTIILVTVFAGREAYGFFDNFSAMLLMLLSTAFIALASVKYKNKTLALTNVLLAGVAPLLVHLPTTNHTGLFMYLLVVVIGALWIVALIGDRVIITAAWAMVLLYSIPMFGLSVSIKSSLLVFGYGFASIFFIASLVGLLQSKINKINVSDFVTAFGNGWFLLLWILSAAPKEWQSLILSSWALVFLAGAYSIQKVIKRKSFFYTYAIIGVIYIAAATATELSGTDLTIAYSIEAGILVLVTYLSLKSKDIAEKVSLVFGVPVLMSLPNIVDYNKKLGLVIHEDFSVLAVITLILVILGVFFYFQDKNKLKELATTYLVSFSIYFYILLWNVLGSAVPNKDMAVMLALLFYTLIGLYMYFKGIFKSEKFSRVYGIVLLCFVTSRLLFIDVWGMDLSGRIITFFVIGSLFVSTAFITTKKPKVGKETNEQ